MFRIKKAAPRIGRPIRVAEAGLVCLNTSLLDLQTLPHRQPVTRLRPFADSPCAEHRIRFRWVAVSAPMYGFQIIDPVALGILLNEESVLVNGNGFGDILGGESFRKMSGLLKSNQIVEVPRKASA